MLLLNRLVLFGRLLLLDRLFLSKDCAYIAVPFTLRNLVNVVATLVVSNSTAVALSY